MLINDPGVQVMLEMSEKYKEEDLIIYLQMDTLTRENNKSCTRQVANRKLLREEVNTSRRGNNQQKSN